MGRRKIEMEMVKNRSSRQVTFSKRRTGLFKKANELATLCASEIAIVVFSPGGKPFSFGNPSFESVAERFLNQDRRPRVGNRGHIGDSRRQARIDRLNNQFNELLRQVQAEEKIGKKLMKAVKSAKARFKPKSIDELGVDELLSVRKAMEELRETLKRPDVGVVGDGGTNEDEIDNDEDDDDDDDSFGEIEASDSLLLLSEKPVSLD